MWYCCEKCGHRERFWNSRDGVTPFGTQCPSCGQASLYHAYFGSDQYAPNHTPPVGQKVWIDMTRERAEQIVRQRIDMLRKHGQDTALIEASVKRHVESFFEHGTSPDMAVSGYGWEPA